MLHLPEKWKLSPVFYLSFIIAATNFFFFFFNPLAWVNNNGSGPTGSRERNALPSLCCRTQDSRRVKILTILLSGLCVVRHGQRLPVRCILVRTFVTVTSKPGSPPGERGYAGFGV